MNWGHKLTIVILLFLVGLGSMVYYASQQDNEMMDAHYYEKELAYQQVIDAKKNLFAVTGQALITQTAEGLVVQFPSGTYDQLGEASIELLRPDSKAGDVFLSRESIDDGRSHITNAQVHKGYYKARMSWHNKGIPYYKEESVYVQ